MRLTRIRSYTASLELLTGLHIGSGDNEMHIGGTDNPVLKHPITREPYIPGSSLKGKVRSLLEWWAGVVAETKGMPLAFKHLGGLEGEQLAHAERIVQLFGGAGDAKDEQSLEQVKRLGPSRLAFWDCALNPDWARGISARNLLLTEAKSENMIDRIRGVAQHPRETERVPAGARFDFRLTLKELNGEDLSDTVLLGLKLLEMDSLGGSGSRGYGKVKFAGLALDGESLGARFQELRPFTRAA